MSGALSHIRVLDLSRILAGPWAAQTLGDFGAEVIKIEHPVHGDDTRGWGPPYIKDADGTEMTDAAYFMTANRNKESVAINIASDEGQHLIRELVQECDVLIENFKFGGLKKYGLDYESLARVKPDLIYCSITGFGHTGPYAHRAGYDFLIQGMSGLMSVTGQAGEEGRPTKVGIPLADLMSGLYAVIGIQAALAHRDKTGEGQHIDVSLLDVQIAALANQAMNYLVSGTPPGRLGNAHPNIVPYGTFETADDYMNLTIGNDGQFAKFSGVAECTYLAEDGRFSTNEARVKNRDILMPLLMEQTRKRPLKWWIDHLEEVHVPCGPIYSIDQVFEDPQVIAREMKINLPHEEASSVPLVNSPLKLSNSPVVHKNAPPLFGQNTQEVLSRLLGLTAEELTSLQESGVIYDRGHITIKDYNVV